MDDNSALQTTDGDIQNDHASALNGVAPAPTAVASRHVEVSAVESDITVPTSREAIASDITSSCESSEAAAYQPTAPCCIDRLPNELLHHIFSYLTIPQQLNLQYVSRRWLRAVRGVLALRDKLDLRELDGREEPGSVSSFRIMNGQLANALSLMPSLRHISCSRPTVFHSDEAIMNTLVSRCPRLVSLDLSMLHEDSTSSCTLRGPWCHLEVFTPPEFGSLRDLDDMLPLLPKLRELRLSLLQSLCCLLLVRNLRWLPPWQTPTTLLRHVKCPGRIDVPLTREIMACTPKWPETMNRRA